MYKHLGLISQTSINDYRFMLLIVIFVQTLSGFSLSIYSITTGPLFLYAVTLLAGVFFMYSSTIDTAQRNLLNSINHGTKSSVFPLLDNEYHAQFYCNMNQNNCYFNAYGHVGTIGVQLVDGKHGIQLFDNKVTLVC